MKNERELSMSKMKEYAEFLERIDGNHNFNPNDDDCPQCDNDMYRLLVKKGYINYIGTNMYNITEKGYDLIDKVEAEAERLQAELKKEAVTEKAGNFIDYRYIQDKKARLLAWIALGVSFASLAVTVVSSIWK